jgi:restriction endonuclease Mrr
VVDLIVAMGYGGARSRVVQALGKSGDEGIDGVVNEDPLGPKPVACLPKYPSAATRSDPHSG